MHFIVYDKETNRVAFTLELVHPVIPEWPGLVTQAADSLSDADWQDVAQHPGEYIVQLSPFKVMRDNTPQNSVL